MTKCDARAGALAVLSLVAAACGDDDGGGDTAATGAATSDDPDDATITEVGEGEGEVNIIAWAGYIERGETDPAYDWVTSFEEETGCKVNVKTAGTSDEMVVADAGRRRRVRPRHRVRRREPAPHRGRHRAAREHST